MALELLRWAASISTITAAVLVAWRGPTGLTAFGFLLFVAASLCWIAAAFVGDRDPLLLQNVALLAVNLFGLARWGLAARHERGRAADRRGNAPPQAADRRRKPWTGPTSRVTGRR